MNNKIKIIPLFLLAGCLVACNSNTSSSSDPSSSDPSSSDSSSSAAESSDPSSEESSSSSIDPNAPTVEEAISAIKAISFDELNSFTQDYRRYQYNYATLEVEENYREVGVYNLYSNTVYGPVTHDELKGCYNPESTEHTEGFYSAYDLEGNYFASAYDLGSLSSYQVYETSNYADKYDLVNNVTYYQNLIANAFEDPTTYFESYYAWDIGDITVSKVDDEYLVIIEATVEADEWYGKEDGGLGVYLDAETKALTGLTQYTRTYNLEILGDLETDTNLYSSITLKDFSIGEREETTPVSVDYSSYPSDRVDDFIPAKSEYAAGTLTEAQALEVLANLSAYTDGTVSASYTGNTTVYDDYGNELDATLTGTRTAYSNDVTIQSETAAYEGGSTTSTSTITGADGVITIASNYGWETYTNEMSGSDLLPVGTVKSYFNASGYYVNSSVSTLAREAVEAGFGTQSTTYGTFYRTLNEATVSEEGVITIDYTSDSVFSFGDYSYGSYTDTILTINNGFLSSIVYKYGSVSQGTYEYSTTYTMVEGELTEYVA